MRILVTGGSGFIGRHLLEALRLEHEVFAPSRTALNLLDQDTTSRYLQHHGFDAVIHAATWDATGTSSKEPSLVLAHNLRMFVNLFREQAHFGRLIHFGSGAEYDRRFWHEGMLEEEAGQRIPLDDYGLSKCLISRLSARSSKVLNLRLFAVFGPGEDWRIRFISSSICRALFDMPLSMRQDRDFDFLHVGDVVSAVRAVLARRDCHGTYNVCRGSTVSLTAVARMILDRMGKNLPITIQLPGKDTAYSGNTKRISTLLAWRPSALPDGIDLQVEWLQSRLAELDPNALSLPP